MRFASGTPLAGRYLLLDELATGSRAAVWRGMDDVLGRPVAVKIYLDAADRAFVHARARTAARLNHPHATAVYDFGDAPIPGGELLPYVVMELLSGEPLADRLATGPLDWPPAVRVAAEIAGALAASHARGVVHGQVGVAAVMLTPTGAKLLGLAGPGHQPTTPPRPADDVAGLGRLLRESLGDLAAVPDPVRLACLACLAAMPADRPVMAEVARTLATEVNRYAATAPDASTLLVPIATAPTERRRPSRAQTALAAAAAFGILALSGVAARYGDDLLAAATRPSTPTSTPATSERHTSGSLARSGQTAAPAGPGTTGGPATPQPGATAGPSTSGPDGSPRTGPTPLPPPVASALDRLRASVDDGRAAGEITPAVATQLDEAIDDVVRRARQDENIHGKVTKLHQQIDTWTRSGAITGPRAADLHAALDAFEAAAGKLGA